MQNIVIILAILITVVAAIPYLVEIANGNVKPRLATWFVWSLLSFISASASFINHQIPAAAFALATGFEAEWVVLLGLRNGDRSVSALDAGCLIGALGCVCILFIANDPVLTVFIAVLVQFIGTIPTFVHSWARPYEEKWVTYALYMPAEALILMVANFSDPTAFIFPIYYLAQDLILTAFSLLSPMRRLNPYPSTADQIFANAESGQSFNLNVRHHGRILGLPATQRTAITGSQAVTAVPGATCSIVIAVMNPPLPSTLSVIGKLPAGLSLTDNGNGQAILSGIAAPGTEGRYPLAITAMNAGGAQTHNVALTVARQT